MAADRPLAATVNSIFIEDDEGTAQDNQANILESTAPGLQSALPSAIGGPLVNLNGQVIGIIVGGSGSGLHVVAYAIPINTALAVATQIDHDHS